MLEGLCRRRTYKDLLLAKGMYRMDGKTNKGKKVIKVTKGREYQAKIDKVYEGDNFFADVYERARDCIYEIYDISEAAKKEILEEARLSDNSVQALTNLSDVKLNYQLRGRVNNLLAFCADRGQGKTSAMRSFACEMQEYTKYKDDNYDRKKFWEGDDRKKRENLPSMYFIECIDPTMMSDDESIIKIILSRMFVHFSKKQHLYREANFSPDTQRNDLARQFQRCFHEAEIMNNEKHQTNWLDEDDLEKMAELGDSSNLLASMYKLIRQYLQYMGANNSYLVIQIDDADMHIRKTYQILNDIRKYLLLPDVIILFAANMTQLESTIEQYFLQEYEISLQNIGSMGSVEYCHNIAALYLEKILPNSRRVFLPRIEEHWENLWIQYFDSNDENEEHNVLRLPKNSLAKNWGIEEQLLYLLHRKTGLLFLTSQNHYHDFLPTNFRELMHFLAYFSKLEELEHCYDSVLDVFQLGENLKDWQNSGIKDNTIETLQLWKTNLELFQDYLVHLWSATNLRENSRKLFIELVETPLFDKHEFILRNLPDYYSYEQRTLGEMWGTAAKSEADSRKEFLQECSMRGVDIPDFESDNRRDIHSYSYADVVTALSVMSDLFVSSRQAKFIYAIRLHYTIIFHQILLKRLDHLQEPPTPDQDITYFMRDAFVKNIREGFKSKDFFLWRIKIEPGIYSSKLENIEKAISPYRLIRISNNFLRRQIEKDNTIVTCPMGKELDWYTTSYQNGNASAYIFHPFYRLLREIDNFTYMNNILKEEVLKNSRLRILLAFSILLNWDVQNELLFLLKQSSLQQNGKGYLFRSIRGLYTGTEMHKLLTEIISLNLDLYFGDTEMLQYEGENERFYRSFSFLNRLFSDQIEDESLELFIETIEGIINNQKDTQNLFSQPTIFSSTSQKKAQESLSTEMQTAQEFIKSIVQTVFSEIRKDDEQKVEKNKIILPSSVSYFYHL